MKRIFFLLLGAALAGCASSPIPEGYKGPLATIDDSYEYQTSTMSHFFVLTEVDGRRIEDSIGKTAEVNYGRGFYMDPWVTGRQVPAQPLTLKLLGSTYHAAPILALTGTSYSVSGEVQFHPQAGQRYIVKGTLGEDYRAVWLEDLDGQVVSQKIEVTSGD